jgi:hypothetical protein
VPVEPSKEVNVRDYLEDLLGGLPIDGVVVFAAQVVVVDPGDVRLGDVDLGRRRPLLELVGGSGRPPAVLGDRIR